MRIEKLRNQSNLFINGPILISNDVFKDNRGFFMESWNKRQFNKLLETEIDFVQDNHSQSDLGVLRGLHYQIKPKAQGKLVRCIKGEIFDVAVDIRINSSTFKKWIGIRLSAELNQQLWIPNGFAHGFLSLSEKTDVLYKTTDYWSSEYERSIKWDDPDIGIAWPKIDSKFKISFKDSQSKYLEDIDKDDLF